MPSGRRYRRVDVDAATIVGLLADPARLKVVAALALGAGTIEDVAAGCPVSRSRTSRSPPAGWPAPGWCTATGTPSRCTPSCSARRPGPPPRPPRRPAPLSDDPAEDAVLSAFVRNGRLTSIPAQRSKRLVVLDHLVRVFEAGVRYPEREVNALLAVWHPDVAALRRYLVDEGLLTREAGVYWRTGGYVEV